MMYYRHERIIVEDVEVSPPKAYRSKVYIPETPQSFPVPFTVSFEGEGEWRVIIEKGENGGLQASVTHIDDIE